MPYGFFGSDVFRQRPPKVGRPKRDRAKGKAQRRARRRPR